MAHNIEPLAAGFPDRFPLRQFLRSDTALRHDIDLTHPPEDVVDNLRWGANHILIPIREHFRKPMIITSGWRPQELNAIIGGSSTSQHLTGNAADFIIVDAFPKDIVDWIMRAEHIRYDQVIREFTWVHISWVRPDSGKIPRREALHTYRDRETRAVKYSRLD